LRRKSSSSNTSGITKTKKLRISFHFQPPPLLRSKKRRRRRRERLSNFTNVNQNQKCTTTVLGF